MDLTTFRNISSQTEQAIGQRRLMEAIELTESILNDAVTPQSNDQILTLRSDYEALLRFVAQGGEDPALETTHYALMRRLIDIQQNAALTWLSANKATIYGRIYESATRHDSLSIDDIFDNLTRLSHAKESNKLFYDLLNTAYGLIWVLPLGEAEAGKLAERIARQRPFARLTLISAVTCATLDRFSPNHLQVLLKLARTALNSLPDDVDMRVRTLMGIICVQRRWREFIQYYQDLTSDLQQLFTKELAHDELLRINDAMVRAAVTDRVSDRADEYLPAISKVLNKQFSRFVKDEELKTGKPVKINVIKIDATNQKMLDLFSRQGRRLERLHKEGYDSHYSAFKAMSSHFEFFHNPQHFFYPFSTQMPYVSNVLDKRGTQNVTLNILLHSNFCDTDCYNYISMLTFINKTDSSLFNALDEQMAELNEEIETPEIIRGVDAYNNYAQMLYRYFDASPIAAEMENVIALNSQTLMPMMQPYAECFTEYSDIETSVGILKWMFNAEAALTLINKLQEHAPATAAMLRDKGEALMDAEKWQMAIDVFQQAQLLDEDDDVQRDIVNCHLALGQWETAIRQLEIIQERNPDADVTEDIALAYMQLHRWDEAANNLFRLEFEGNTSKAIKRAIGWCALNQGKYTRAEQYYSQLTTARNSRWEDHLNMGHALWLQGKHKAAIEAYTAFVTTFNKAKDKNEYKFWQEAFADDAKQLFGDTTSAAMQAIVMDAIALATNTESH